MSIILMILTVLSIGELIAIAHLFGKVGINEARIKDLAGTHDRKSDAELYRQFAGKRLINAHAKKILNQKGV